MLTSASNGVTEVSAKNLWFIDDILVLKLSDGRELKVPTDKISWLSWLYKASPDQREKWELEPGGFAVYWEALEDGIEVNHLLSLEPLV
jgi:Protein of unknown function (DUF2442)